MAFRTRRTRSQTPRKFRLHKPHWIDPFPQIPGTEPEKRVFAMLVAMKVYFIFQGQVPEFEKGNKLAFLAPPNYKPDFVLPEYRIIIDPFGVFHHSMDDAVARDIRKVASYQATGYTYYHPWALGPGQWLWNQYTASYDPAKLRKAGVKPRKDAYGRAIGKRPKLVGQMDTLQMLLSIPELRIGPMYPLTDPRDITAKKSPGFRIGQYLGAGANSVAAANRNRRKPGTRGISFGQRATRRRS